MQQLADLKKRSKCMHCGAIGHWAGDPACKFPGSRRQGQKRDQFRVRDGNVFQAEFKANTMPATANFVHVKTKHTPQGKTQKLFKQTRETTLKNIAWNTYTHNLAQKSTKVWHRLWNPELSKYSFSGRFLTFETFGKKSCCMCFTCMRMFLQPCLPVAVTLRVFVSLRLCTSCLAFGTEHYPKYGLRARFFGILCGACKRLRNRQR